jgi:Trp operon repressor
MWVNKFEKTIIKININNKDVMLTIKENNRYEVIKELLNNQLTNEEAGKKLNLSIRQVKRIKKKVKEEEIKKKGNGILGVIHGLRNRKGNRKSF